MVAATRSAIAISPVAATVTVGAVIDNAASQEAADGEQYYSKFFHDISNQ
jgi:hypothetical protein